MPVKISADARNAFRKIQKARRLILIHSKKTVDNLTELGKVRAKEIAPYYTGKTAKLIRRLPSRQLKEGVSATVVAPNPTKERANFNLVRWMHESNGILRGKKHIKSGEPQFMYKTRNYLNRIKGKVAQAEFNKIKL